MIWLEIGGTFMNTFYLSPLLNMTLTHLQNGMGPSDLGTAYRPYNHQQGNSDGANRGSGYVSREQQKQQMADADLLDVNAAIHGNWNIENAKAKLHQYMQMNGITTEYRYQSIGPDHARYNRGLFAPHVTAHLYYICE